MIDLKDKAIAGIAIWSDREEDFTSEQAVVLNVTPSDCDDEHGGVVELRLDGMPMVKKGDTMFIRIRRDDLLRRMNLEEGEL